MGRKRKAAKKKRGVTLLFKVISSNILLMGIVLLLTMTVSLRYSVQRIEQKVEAVLISTSQTLARSEAVVRALEEQQTSGRLNDFLDYAIAVNQDLDVITVADMNGKRYFHPDKSRIGQHFVGGDEERVLAGETYLSEATGTLGLQRRAFCPIYGSEGTQIGFVMVSTLMTSMEAMRSEVLAIYMRMALIIFLIGLAVSLALAENIKNSLLGYEPSQMAQIFIAREEVLEALDEGIISVDKQGETVLANHAAAAMLHTTVDGLIQKDINQLLPAMRLTELLESGVPQHNCKLVAANDTLLCDKIPIRQGKKIIGAVAVLRSKTEATRLAEQLTGTRHIIHALRANTHEFMNSLHVILGLLQTGESEEAGKYIQGICEIQAETISPVLHCIHNPTLAALILGKMNRMHELDIESCLLPNSYLPRHSRYLSTQSLVTVVGNLLENAIEAIHVREDGGPRRVTLQISQDDQGLHISVDDTGIGMTPEEISLMLIRGYSTKGENRGIGMALIKETLEFCDGDIQIDSEKQVGTSILVTVKAIRSSYQEEP